VPDAVKRALTNGSPGKQYDLSFRMNPSYLEGYFNGDGKDGRGGFSKRTLDREAWDCDRS